MNLRWAQRVRRPSKRRRASKIAYWAFRGRQTALRWSRSSFARHVWQILCRPAQILAAALVGATYAAILTSFLGVLIALVMGIIKGRPDIEHLASHLRLNAFVTAPMMALTVGTIALGIGAIIGVVSVTARRILLAGLEWTIVGGIGVAVGFGVRYRQLSVLLLAAFLAGAVIGGMIGFLTWLRHYTTTKAILDARALSFYILGVILIAIHTSLTAGWYIAMLG